jgi:hypothetical protein
MMTLQFSVHLLWFCSDNPVRKAAAETVMACGGCDCGNCDQSAEIRKVLFF